MHSATLLACCKGPETRNHVFPLRLINLGHREPSSPSWHSTSRLRFRPFASSPSTVFIKQTFNTPRIVLRLHHSAHPTVLVKRQTNSQNPALTHSPQRPSIICSLSRFYQSSTELFAKFPRFLVACRHSESLALIQRSRPSLRSQTRAPDIVPPRWPSQ